MQIFTRFLILSFHQQKTIPEISNLRIKKKMKRKRKQNNNNNKDNGTSDVVFFRK